MDRGLGPGGRSGKAQKRVKYSVKHAISLSLVLFAVWLLLSGHFVPLLLAFGVLSCVIAVAISMRMDVIDHEGHPIHLGWRAIFYWPWLIWQIVLANLSVARIILSPSMPISPNIVIIDAEQHTELGRVIFANSITLTPGTVSLELDRDRIVVHALTEAAALELSEGAMNRKVTRMEGHS